MVGISITNLAWAAEGVKFEGSLPTIPCIIKNCINDPSKITSIPDLITYIYNLAFWIVGLALFFAFFSAGIKWILAGPNITSVGKAKTQMTNAVIGFIILLASWLILNTINPELVKDSSKNWWEKLKIPF